MKKKVLLLFLFLACTLLSVFSDNSSEDPLFLTDVPVYFGSELFLEKIGNTESPLGLVFSGGAARAFAHIGVLKKLEEEGIYPDFIVANSMGSIVALLYAAGASPDTIQDLFLSFSSDFLFRPGIPVKGGVLDPGKFISLLYRIFGELDIRDLQIPVVILSEDLATRRQIVFMEGDFYSILQASISMPFSFPPVEYNNMVLIDGGISNLTPVQAAAEYTDRIIVSTAFYNRESSYRNFVSILNRAFDISKTRKGISELKKIEHLLIRCEVEEYSFMDFHRMDVISEKGYLTASRVLSALDDPGKWRSENTEKIIDSLLPVRQKVDRNIEMVKKEYHRTGAIPQKSLARGYTAGFDMFRGRGDDYYLDNSYYFYLGKYGEINYFQTETRGFFQVPGETGADTISSIILFNALRLKGRALFRWDDFNYSESYLYGRADINITADGRTGILPYTALESVLDRNFSSEEYFFRGGLKLYHDAYSVSGYYFEENPQTRGAGAENDFKIKTIGNFYLDQRTVYRSAPDQQKNLRLYLNDGIRASVEKGYFENILVLNNSLSFRTATSLTFGEILLVKSMAASVFCDYFYLDTGGVSTGLSLDLDISFIGLSSIYFTAFAGYDYLNTDIFARVVIGSGS